MCVCVTKETLRPISAKSARYERANSLSPRRMGVWLSVPKDDGCIHRCVYACVEARVRGACACTCVAAVRVACAKGY